MLQNMMHSINDIKISALCSMINVSWLEKLKIYTLKEQVYNKLTFDDKVSKQLTQCWIECT
jgi:hypothetical protein